MSRKTSKAYDLEKTLKAHYQSPEPSPEFVRSLEMQLKGVEEPKGSGFPTRIFENTRVRRALAPVALALALVLVVAAIGPQEVLAQVQAWIGYVPGVGFVDVNTARVLGEPLAQTRGDVTLTVKQVLASADDTFVVVSMDNFPTYEEILGTLGPLTADNRYEWIGRSQALWDTPARLILDDDRVLESWNFSGSYWDGYFSFPALPEGVLASRLEIDRIPGIPAGMAPGNWSFKIELTYAADPQALDLPEATPVGVSSEILHGVSLRVLDVVYSPSEISIRVQSDDMPDGWQLTYHNLDGRLHDDLGNEYTIVYGPNSGADAGGIQTLSFRPLLPGASRLELSVINLALTVDLVDQAITVDCGSGLQEGDRIEIDQTIDVLGRPVRFVAATVHEGEVASFVDADGVLQHIPMVTYDFEIESLPNVDGLAVSGLELSSDVLASLVDDRIGAGITVVGSSGARLEEDGSYSLSISLGLPADAPLPSGVITIPIEKAFVTITDPISIEWAVE